jgi:CheY-like chemotaxis protein
LNIKHNTKRLFEKELAMTATRKVLVVDDDPAVRKSIDRVLSGKGYAVITAENGEQALRKLNEENYDLVYTDIRMPGMSGLEVAEQVKAQQPWTPVVIITGYGTDAAEARAKAAGVSGFVHKPLSPEMIEGSARDALAAPVAAAAAVVLPGIAEAPLAEAPLAEAPLAEAPLAEAPLAESATLASRLKNIALFFAAPFIGLLYIAALPFVGLGLLAFMAARAAAKIEAVKTTAMVLAAPFIGLAFIVCFPLIGLAMLAAMGGRAVVEAGASRMR